MLKQVQYDTRKNVAVIKLIRYRFKIMSTNSLLYLHKKTISSNEIRNDVDFLLELLFQEGSKQKRWEVYLNENDAAFEDENIHSHCSLLEYLAYREAVVEGLSEEKALLLMWTARFYKLGEMENGDTLFNLKTKNDGGKKSHYVRKHIHSKLQSDYAKNMLEKVLAISLDKKNLLDENFDFVDFFDSLKRRGSINTALKMIQQKSILRWDVLAANVLFNQIVPLVEHGKKYRSVRVYLQKNSKQISHALENHFTHEQLIRGFEKIYGQDDFEEKKKFLDISPEKVLGIKNVWFNFVQEN